MVELFACFVSAWLGCGFVEVTKFDTWEQCEKALAEVKRDQKLSHAYCRPQKTEGG